MSARRWLCAALLVVSAQPVVAQVPGLTLVSRETLMSGFFLVGYSTLGDGSGNLSNNDSTLATSFSQVLADAGAVNGFAGDTPVVGSGGFSTAQSFDVGATGITASGESLAETSVAYNYMSAGARASNTLKLTFSVAAATPFTLDGSLINGGLRAPAAVSLTCVSACSSSSWQFSSTGDFSAAGTLAPGNWLLYANAGGRAIPNEFRLSSYDLALQLAPVPEPQSWALMVSGAVVLLFSQRRRRGRPQRHPG